jgi:dolichol kinase
MSDAWLVALWVSILLGGLAGAGALARLGLPETHVRDVLHVGAGVWPLGWPYWHSPLPPLAIVGAALLGMALLPLLARRLRWLERVQRAVSGEDERWSGLVLYTGSAAVLTGLGLLVRPFPAAAAFFALALGDGVGGAVGLGLGRLRFQVPGGKQKSLEGSLAVALFSTLGVLLAARWFAVPAGLGLAALAGLLAALAEAVAPRATDNVVLPASVWGMLAFYPRVS